MDATENFYNRSGYIVQSNRFEQQKKTITWADKIDTNDNDSAYTMPSFQIPQSHDDDSSGNEYSYSTRDDVSIDSSNDEHSMPIL